MATTGKGGYIVGFTVHEAKELSRDGNQVDPLVVIRALGREHKTELKRDKLNVAKFEESFIWSDIQLTSDEYNSAFIDFELQSANVFTRNDVIGTGKVQLSMVRKRPNHSYVKKWIQLSVDSMKTAKLLVTVFSYGEGDTPPRPEDIEHDAEEVSAQLKDLGAAVLSADAGKTAKVFTTGYHLFVQVHRAEHLGGGTKTYNPSVSVEFAGSTLFTPEAKNTHTLAFDECFRLPVTMPLFSDSIIVRVWDKKSWQADDIIVQGRLSFSLIRTHALMPKWFNFYGFNADEVPDISSITGGAERPEPNTYQGRILVSARAQRVAKETDLFKPAIIKGVVLDEPASIPQTILCDVSEVSGCPGKEVYVQLSYGKSSKKTKTVKRAKDSESMDHANPGIFRFANDKGSLVPINTVIPASPEQQLDVIISIWADLDEDYVGKLSGGSSFQRIGFARVKTKNIANWMGEGTAPRWLSCKPMAHLPTSIEPGAILCSLYKCAKIKTDRKPCEVRIQHFQLRVYACSARNLVSGAGSSQQPNAFLQASCAGENKKTEIIIGSKSPSWNQCLNLKIRLLVSEKDSKAYPEPIQITVYDQVGDSRSMAEQLKDAASSAAGVENNSAEETNETHKELARLKQEDNFDMLARLGQEALQGAVDKVGVMTGDVMAKKRLGEITMGRRVVGRVQVPYRRVTRPGDKSGFQPQWMKLKGGMMGNAHTGDVLIGFELLKAKHSPLIPERDFKVAMYPCSLFVSILGLRDIDPIGGGDVAKPVLQVLVDSVGQPPAFEDIPWKRKPAAGVALNNDDVNRKWELNSKQGYEFCKVVHLPVSLPDDPLWSPYLQFLVKDDETLVGEGSISLAHYIPWADTEETDYAITAKDEFSDSEDDGEGDGGVNVSADEAEAEEQSGGASVQYITVKIENEALGVQFNKEDGKTIPPLVTNVDPKGKVGKAGIKPTDILLGLKLPTNEPEKDLVHWTPAETAKFLENCDKNRIRPLFLRFRRTLRTEVTVTVRGSEPLGFDLQTQPGPPSKFGKDNTRQLMYTKKAIDPGWFLVAVNGVDTVGMGSGDPRLRTLLGKRPSVLTWRAPKDANIGSVTQEREISIGKPVQLTGLPKELDPRFSPLDKNQMAKKLGGIRFSRVPKPTPQLPAINDLKRLNLHPGRAGTLEVRGIIKNLADGPNGQDEDDAADHNRPTANGVLEDMLPQPYFESVPLTKGGQCVGKIKVRVYLIDHVNADWAKNLPDSHMGSFFYNPKKFRKWIKQDTPEVFRVRSYVIRGLNVSGANSGYGNPYLFFVYGAKPVRLPGHRQMNEVEPRFFRTEERDIKMPAESLYEVGLYDWSGAEEDELIGKSCVDLEDRWFSPAYQTMVTQNRVPIEYRPMTSTGNLCKGNLEMWIDLLDASHAGEVPLSPLKPPDPVEIEIRVVIWTCKEVSLRLCCDENTGEQREHIDAIAKVQLDCRSYGGSQPRDQDTDVHHHSDGELEFNWRFVFSKISVTKGVPLDCFLQISLLEYFTIARPKLICETMVEMKNYCKKVALSGESVSIEAHLPLENQQLKKQLQSDAARVFDGEDEEDEEGSDEGGAMNYGDDEEVQLPPAGLVKVQVQVLPQVQASGSDFKVGLGRNEPNRLPSLTFPTTGRSWQAVLPAVTAVIESIIEAYQGGTKRAKILLVIIFILAVIVGLHKVPGDGGCPIIQDSCKTKCAVCQMCADGEKDDKLFCYYKGYPDYPSLCASGTKNTYCRVYTVKECGVVARPAAVPAAISFPCNFVGPAVTTR